MIFDWIRNGRRQGWLEASQPAEWENWLREGVWQYNHLPYELGQRVRDFVAVLFHEKHWEGGDGFEVSDQMRVTIAGQAALLTLGFNEPYFFDKLRSIIVYRGSYEQRPVSHENLFIGRLQEQMPTRGQLLGESWQGGPIVLAWNVLQRDGRNARRRRSLVLHEFAHHLDGLDGSTDGTPPMNSYRFEKQWYEITSREFQQLLHFAQQKQRTLLDHYGATNHAEFFAVSTECFFTTPHAFATQHQQLYDVMVRFFGQDPRHWLPPTQLDSNIA